MLVLGLNFGFHDPSAALVEDGRLLALSEEERHCRERHARRQAPAEACRTVLRLAGRGVDDLDAIAIGWDFDLFEPPLERDWLQRPDAVWKWLGPMRPDLPVHCVPHHLAHAASGFWCSGEGRAAIMVVDGQGEHESVSLGVGDSDGITFFHSAGIPQSLGHFYRAASEYAGLTRGTARGEGKLMGLAAYGRPSASMPTGSQPLEFLSPEVLVPHTAHTRTEIRASLRSWWTEHAFPYNDGGAEGPFAYADFAASAQQALEQFEFSLAERLAGTTGCSALVVSGGVGLNCSANGALVDSGIFENVHVGPVAFDAGVALGAALQVCWEQSRRAGTEFRPERMSHAYYGNDVSEEAIAAALDRSGLTATRFEDDAELEDLIAGELAGGKVIGWFQGRSEIGPRALGARSVLADPRDREAVRRINSLKGRESWRPLAPSIKDEAFDAFFDSPHRSPFMNVRAFVRPSSRRTAPAVVHVDGSARPQSVDRAVAPRYWGLIDGFEKRTGVPVLLNTSLNLAGEPIVDTPENALEVLRKGMVDMLAIGPFVISQ